MIPSGSFFRCISSIRRSAGSIRARLAGVPLLTLSGGPTFDLWRSSGPEQCQGWQPRGARWQQRRVPSDQGQRRQSGSVMSDSDQRQ